MANLLVRDGATVSKYLKTSGAGSDGDPHVPEHSLAKAGTATLSNVSASASNGTALASNADRMGVLWVNDSTATCYLKYGATATSSSYSVKLEPGSYWEMPQPIWTGQIDAIWSAANGAARITELEV